MGGLAQGDVTVWGDESLDWVQVFTAKGRDSGVERRAVASRSSPCRARPTRSTPVTVWWSSSRVSSWTAQWGVEPAALA